jgi:hypothetical protein
MTDIVIPARYIQSFDSSERKNLVDLINFINAQLIESKAESMIELAGWYDQSYENGAEATPEGMVLYFYKDADPTDAGEFYADYMPKIRDYNPGPGVTSHPPTYSIPSTAVNRGAGKVQVSISLLDDWVDGMVHEFVQAGAGVVEVVILDGEDTINVICMDDTGTTLGPFNDVYTAIVRSTGPGAVFTVRKVSATDFVVNGNVEVVP